MRKSQWLLALPLALVASIGPARASSIRDEAGLFNRATVRQAEAHLNQVEQASGLTTTIETIDSLEGQTIREVALRHAQRSGTEGLYILIPKQEHKIDILASRPYRQSMTGARLDAITDAFKEAFKRGEFDAGLVQGVKTIEREVAQAKAENGGVLTRSAPGVAPVPRGPMGARPVPVPRRGGGFGIGALVLIGLGIVVVLFGIRLLGSLFGGGQRAGYPGPGGRPMGGPGYGGPGAGPGYGYGGRGGGFWSSVFGGIGGAMAGNWLYDQMSGRHHGGTYDQASYGGESAPPADAGGDWAGGNESVGDWGGGDAGGGGGDWGGGGGGDWGGGGGGGGDWGGGGGAGGDW